MAIHSLADFRSESLASLQDQPPKMVCGRSITYEPPYRNTADYQGQPVCFCTEYCLEAFLSDPDRFYAAHSKAVRD
jgi:YHS domain-containing protein